MNLYRLNADRIAERYRMTRGKYPSSRDMQIAAGIPAFLYERMADGEPVTLGTVQSIAPAVKAEPEEIADMLD